MRNKTFLKFVFEQHFNQFKGLLLPSICATRKYMNMIFNFEYCWFEGCSYYTVSNCNISIDLRHVFKRCFDLLVILFFVSGWWLYVILVCLYIKLGWCHPWQRTQSIISFKLFKMYSKVVVINSLQIQHL